MNAAPATTTVTRPDSYNDRRRATIAGPDAGRSTAQYGAAR
ncbi:hypothetical protein [Frankia sp. Cppng1_Ct_nod]|nr:hypothetical protein [Frankia sp. Cppng1_Ct_nod]